MLRTTLADLKLKRKQPKSRKRRVWATAVYEVRRSLALSQPNWLLRHGFTPTVMARWEVGITEPEEEELQKLAAFVGVEGRSEFGDAFSLMRGGYPQTAKWRLHVALDIILQRAPQIAKEEIVETLEEVAAKYGAVDDGVREY